MLLIANTIEDIIVLKLQKVLKKYKEGAGETSQQLRTLFVLEENTVLISSISFLKTPGIQVRHINADETLTHIKKYFIKTKNQLVTKA
jgi:hypothetical protein